MIKIDDEICKELKLKNKEAEKILLNSNATKDSEAIYEKKKNHAKYISNFASDAEKIINTKAYTRYMGKTQVFSLVQNDLITTRGLHVQLVASIARTIGKNLGFNTELIEAIALGHDLGHTPFGHEGENALNEITKKYGYYFKHNAQSVRILRDIMSANISIQVLDGITCHNGKNIDNSKKEGYKPNKEKTLEEVISEYEACFTQDKIYNKYCPMTYEGCIMRISDIIAYVGRDFEDAISLKLLKREDIPKEVEEVLGNTNAKIVKSIIADILNNSYGQDSLKMSDDCYKAVKQLRDYNFEHIYKSDDAIIDLAKKKKMFGLLFDKYLYDIEKGNGASPIMRFIEGNNKTYKKSNRPEVMVCDFIAGMTDEFFINEFTDYMIPRKVKTLEKKIIQ